MSDHQQDVTEAELAVLQALWDAGPATIRQLVERVYQQTGTSVYGDGAEAARAARGEGVRRAATGAVRCTSSGRSIDRDELIGRRLRAVADSLCGGSLSPLLTHLVEGKGLSAKEQRELRALIDKLDDRRRR